MSRKKKTPPVETKKEVKQVEVKETTLDQPVETLPKEGTNEVKMIASHLYAVYLDQLAEKKYNGNIFGISQGDLVEVAKLSMKHAKVLDELNEFDY